MPNLVVIFGDQLNRSSAVFDDFDKTYDAIWMAEVAQELTHVWCHKLRIAFFLSAMRHFRNDLQKDGFKIHYHELGERKSDDRSDSFSAVLRRDVRRLRPHRLIVAEPGDYRV